MKKFFKILRKIIKFILISFLSFILWSFIILISIIYLMYRTDTELLIVEWWNSRNHAYTLDDGFSMKEWSKIKFDLKNFKIIITRIYDYNKIDYKRIIDYKKNGNSHYIGYYYGSENIYNENEILKNCEITTWYYINGNIFHIWKYWKWNDCYNYDIYYDENWNIIWTWNHFDREWIDLVLRRDNGNIEFNLKYVDWKPNWFISLGLENYYINDWKKDWLYTLYYKNWSINIEWNYNYWEKIWIWTGYYDDWNIKDIKFYINWKLNWISTKYYKNWIKEEWNYINDLWVIYNYYNKFWDFIWSWGTVCLLFSWDDCVEKQKNWLYIEYDENIHVQIYNEWNYENWKKIWIWTGYHDDWNIEYVYNCDNWELVYHKDSSIYSSEIKEEIEDEVKDLLSGSNEIYGKNIDEIEDIYESKKEIMNEIWNF